MRRRAVPLVLLLVALAASAAHAETVCYSEAYYSPVLRLTRTQLGVEAVLGGRALEPKRAPVLIYAPARGWEVGPPLACDSDRGCGEPAASVQPAAPRVNLSKAEAVRLRPTLRRAESIEQRIGATAEHDGFVWFGLAFYEGEGVNGECAQAFADWITSPETQEEIGRFGVAEYGEPLFFPDAKG